MNASAQLLFLQKWLFATTILCIKSYNYRQIRKEINTANRWLALDVKFNHKRTQRPIPLKYCNEGTDIKHTAHYNTDFYTLQSMVSKLALYLCVKATPGLQGTP